MTKDLEREKLYLEIQNLRRPWYRRPNIIISIAAVLVSFGLLFAAFWGLLQKEINARIEGEQSIRAIVVKVEAETENTKISVAKNTDTVRPSCDKIKDIIGPWKVACNAATESGYYWKVEGYTADERIGLYGWYGMKPEGGYPPCNEEQLGKRAQTAAWRDSENWWPVAKKWRRAHEGGVLVEGKEGPTINIKENHTGVYSVICTKHKNER